jgi:prepilin-type processing-associated H-X9-DG protein
MFFLLPYMEQEPLYKSVMCNPPGQGLNPHPSASIGIHTPVKSYVCPADPTVTNGIGGPTGLAIGSYVFNGQVFVSDQVLKSYANFPAALADGTSQTILFTESYGGNYAGSGFSVLNYWWWDYASFQANSDPTGAPTNPDCGPLNKWNVAATPLAKPAVSVCGDPTKAITFTSGTGSPCLCQAVSPHTGGINVAMGDGSVKIVSDGISGPTWYHAVTPASSDLLGPDW